MTAFNFGFEDERQQKHGLLEEIEFGDMSLTISYQADFENGEWIPSANPVGLNGSGAQTGSYPAILERRVLPEAAFTGLFGSPPS